MLKVNLARFDEPTTIDGWIPASDASKSRQLALQTQPTTYGDNIGELDKLVGRLDADGAYIGVTGNLPPNGDSSLVVLVDTGLPGQNVLHTGTLVAPPPGLEGLNGMKLDPGFNPSRAIFVNTQNNTYYVDGFYLNANGAISKTYLGQGPNGWGLDALQYGTNPTNVRASLNNSNTLGVTGTSGLGAATATTGVELKLPYAFLGVASTTPSIKVAAFLVRAGGIVSNQWLPPAIGKLSDLGKAPDMTKVAGNQFVTLTR